MHDQLLYIYLQQLLLQNTVEQTSKRRCTGTAAATAMERSNGKELCVLATEPRFCNTWRTCAFFLQCQLVSRWPVQLLYVSYACKIEAFGLGLVCLAYQP